MKNGVRSVLFRLFDGKLLCTENAPREKMVSIAVSLVSISFHGQRSRSNCWSLYKCCPINIFSFFSLNIVKIGTDDAKETRYTCILLIFCSHCQRSWSNCWSSDQCVLQCTHMSHFLIVNKIATLLFERRLSLLHFMSQGQD